MEVISDSIEKTKIVAKNFLERVQREKHPRAVFVALSGQLGSGKTTFTQETAKVLGIKDNLTSPTFVIYKRYPIPGNKSFKNLYHFDTYRIENPSELLNLGFEDILGDKENLIYLEWPENVREIIPKDAYKISFDIMEDSKREIKIDDF